MQSELRRGTSDQRHQEIPNLVESPAEGPDDRIAQRQSMVFEEIAIVVRTDTFAAHDPIKSTDNALYMAVKGFLNVALALQEFARQYGVAGVDLFQDLASRDRRPGVLLDRKEKIGTAILFYGLALKPETQRDKSPAERSQPIREIATAINKRLAGQVDGREQAWQIEAATPNWLATAASDDSGSPAAPPKPARVPVDEPQKWTFLFTSPENATPAQINLQGCVDSQRDADSGSNIVVALLDTCPDVTKEDLATAFPTNELFLEVAGVAGVSGKPIEIEASSPARFTQVEGVVPSWLGWLRTLFATGPEETPALIRRSYSIPSHGLFSAGIVKDIVPHAKIRLIGMLNNVGMSSLDVLADIIEGLPRSRARGENLIVNLSWTTSTLPADMDEDSHYLDALQALIEWLGEKDVLVVAAAGNNALDPTAAGRRLIGNARPEPRFPAAFALDNVLSVAATEITFTDAAKYSNRASAVGVATVGGDALLNAMSKSEIETEPASADLDAINGIYLESPLAITEEQNRTGWVSWAGTSFATPIISAVAAALWATDNSLATPSDVIAKVRSFAEIDTRPELNAKAIYARQDIRP